MTHEEMIEAVRLAHKRVDSYELMLVTAREQLAEQKALREKAHVQIAFAEALADAVDADISTLGMLATPRTRAALDAFRAARRGR